MARRTTVELLDDLDGSPAEETITFTVDGKSYEIDLNTENAAAFRGELERYMTAGRRVGTMRRSPSRGAAQRSSQETAAIREWARANGHEVSDRGRISREVADAYAAAH